MARSLTEKQSEHEKASKEKEEGEEAHTRKNASDRPTPETAECPIDQAEERPGGQFNRHFGRP